MCVTCFRVRSVSDASEPRPDSGCHRLNRLLGGVASGSETLMTWSAVVTSPSSAMHRSVWCKRALRSVALLANNTAERITRTTLPRGFRNSIAGSLALLASPGGDWAEAEQKKAKIVRPKKERIGDSQCLYLDCP
jgi:hypothetical protein